MNELIINYLMKYSKVSIDEMVADLGMSDAKSFQQLIKAISKLESQGKLRFDHQGNLFFNERKKKKDITVTGTFRANRLGYGFLTIDENEDDLFIGRSDVGCAIDGDKVEAVIKKTANRMKGTVAEARIVDIVERGLKTVVGKFVLDDSKSDYIGYIISKNQKIRQKIYIPKDNILLSGTEIIKVDIDNYPTHECDYFVGHVRDIIGHQGDVGIDVLEILESMDIVSEFPKEVLSEAEAISDTLTEKDMFGRVDLRDEMTFTIDGTDAKDLDDAVHIKLLDNGHFELGVHIADVSYYVREESALNHEASKRGTSVYVTDRVVPMLPERLSNGICSLNPNVDRLTQSCIMEIDRKGRIVNYRICSSVIKTIFRMTYHDVNAIIAGDKQLMETYQLIVDALHHMVALHHILEKMRTNRGAINFDTSEAKIVVDDKGLPIDIVLRKRGIAECMIESFMLVANETVAEHFAKRQLPFIYRIHEEPKAEKLQKFFDYASIFGIPIHGTAQKVTQQALQEFMAKVESLPGAEVLNMMLLRSMQQARYSEHNHGHYGLAASYYTHFTSPIRRYPDLLVHRMIREYTQVTDDKIEHFKSIIPELASSSSICERRAIDAERLVEAMKKAEYMENYMGQEFDGIVSSVVKFGMFIELPNTVEGLVHITTLPEFYHYNERSLTLQSEKTGKVFRVGQQIKIKLTRADKETGDIDFEYLPSEYDVIEKVKKAPIKTNRFQKMSQKNHHQKVKTSKKSNVPFYKEVTKKKSRKRKK